MKTLKSLIDKETKMIENHLNLESLEQEEKNAVSDITLFLPKCFALRLDTIENKVALTIIHSEPTVYIGLWRATSIKGWIWAFTAPSQESKFSYPTFVFKTAIDALKHALEHNFNHPLGDERLSLH
jgi:hypothetical protein